MDPKKIVDVVMLACLFPFAILGIVGNSLIIAVVKTTPSMHTTTNYLLVNLAVADAITLLFSPMMFAYGLFSFHPSGTPGDYICKFFTGNAVVDVTITASVFTLTTIAIERYHAVVKPMRSGRRLTEDNVGRAIALIWGSSVLVSLPAFVMFSYDESEEECSGPWSLSMSERSKIYVIVNIIVVVFLPFLTIFWCYVQLIKELYFNNAISGVVTENEDDRKAKKRLIKMSVIVTVVFFLCYFPYVFFMLSVISSSEEVIEEHYNVYYVLSGVVALLEIINSCMNPLLYACHSVNYRNGFKRLCVCSSNH